MMNRIFKAEEIKAVRSTSSGMRSSDSVRRKCLERRTNESIL